MKAEPCVTPNHNGGQKMMKCPLTLDRGLSFGNGLCFGSKKYRVDSAVKGNSPHTMITDVINVVVKMS